MVRGDGSSQWPADAGYGPGAAGRRRFNVLRMGRGGDFVGGIADPGEGALWRGRGLGDTTRLLGHVVAVSVEFRSRRFSGRGCWVMGRHGVVQIRAAGVSGDAVDLRDSVPFVYWTYLHHVHLSASPLAPGF